MTPRVLALCATVNLVEGEIASISDVIAARRQAVEQAQNSHDELLSRVSEAKDAFDAWLKANRRTPLH